MHVSLGLQHLYKVYKKNKTSWLEPITDLMSNVLKFIIQ
jgi:hypothetical protein